MKLLRLFVFAANQPVLPRMDVCLLQIASRGCGFNEDLQLTADKRLGHSLCNGMLRGHGAIAALLFYSVGYLILHASGARTFLLRIREHAEALELGLSHEIQQRFETRVGFARETHNKRSA